MFNLPVNLIKKPIEYAVVVLWLAAIAQFFNFVFVHASDVAFYGRIDWFITAIALMVVAIVIALRMQTVLPLFAAFLLGLSALLAFFNPEFKVSKTLLVASSYSVIFWLLCRYFFKSSFFWKIYQWLGLDSTHKQDAYKQVSSLTRVCFYLCFSVINSCVLFAVAEGVDNSVSVLLFIPIFIPVFILAIFFLFICEKFISADTRGLLLPLYSALIISIYANLSGSHLFIWAVVLWFCHNVISPYYNQAVTSKKINTQIWPWYGLFFVLFMVFEHFPGSFIDSSHLSLLLLYLFLMLRNTSLSLISNALMVSLFALFVLLLIPAEPLIDNTLFYLSAFYNHAFLLYVLFLLLGSILWDAYFNPFLIRIGWQKISFKTPILVIAFVIALFCLFINFMGALELVIQSKQLFYIKPAPFLLLLVFFALFLFVSNKVVAHLLHFNLLLCFLFIGQENLIVPVYLLFSLLFLLWIIVPLVIKARFNTIDILLPQGLTFSTNNLLITSYYWAIINFVMSSTFLFIAMGQYNFDFAHITLLITLLLLFIGSLILINTQDQQQHGLVVLWHLIAYVLVVAMILSLRLLFMGSVPVNEVDTIGLFIITFSFYKVRDLPALSSTLINAHTLAKILPLLILFTIPWTLGSLHSSLSLFVLGLFYFLIQKNNRMLHYGALLLLNIAVYLWMPMLSDWSGLLLFYVIPVVFSVLFVTYLHKNEINPKLLHKVRLMALSVLYIVVVADVFINDSLLAFSLALCFALVGIIIAISSKNRAFLYTAVSFMIIVIGGQLLSFYPEGRLARALILMLLGATITALMIWFNIKREVFLSKIRLFRADLDSWD